MYETIFLKENMRLNITNLYMGNKLKGKKEDNTEKVYINNKL